MPRKINRKCQNCSQLPHEKAIQRDCWDNRTCHKRRSHYRHRSEVLARRKVQAKDTEGILIEPDSVPPSLVLVIYSEHPNRKDSSILAVGAELWRGSTKVNEMVPVSTLGMQPQQVSQIFPAIIKAFNAQHRLSFQQFTARVDRHIRDCPIQSPYKEQV